MKKSVTFPNGLEMPIIGYGMWQSLIPEELEKALDVALDAGYRHFDTAYTYDNEVVFGNVLKRWFDTGKVKREELFIVTKLPVFGSHHERVETFLKISLERLQLDYVDLYLIHQPAGIKVDETGLKPLKEDGKVVPDLTTTVEDVWKAMEAQVPTGRAKSIGLSNFSVSQVERIAKMATIMPANHQVELNAYYPKKQLREIGAKHGITTCAFAPLGSPGRKESYKNANDAHLKVQIPPLLEDPTVNEIAKKHNRPASQVLLTFFWPSRISLSFLKALLQSVSRATFRFSTSSWMPKMLRNWMLLTPDWKELGPLTGRMVPLEFPLTLSSNCLDCNVAVMNISVSSVHFKMHTCNNKT